MNKRIARLLLVALGVYLIQIGMVVWSRNCPYIEKERGGAKYSVYRGQRLAGMLVPVLGLWAMISCSPLTLRMYGDDGRVILERGYDTVEDIVFDYPFMQD